MTTPALVRLRERFPRATVTMLTHEKLADLYKQHPAVDEITTFSAGQKLSSVASNLARVKAEMAIILPNSPRSAIEAWLARVPVRVGHSRGWANWFLSMPVPHREDKVATSRLRAGRARTLRVRRTERVTFPTSAHQIYDYLHLVGSVGASLNPVAPVIRVDRPEIAEVLARFGMNGPLPGARALLGLNPGAEYGPAKRWPLNRFVEASSAIASKINCVWLIFGSAAFEGSAVEMARQLTAAGVTHLNLAGKTTLRELCVLLKLCRVLLTNDSGPMHLAGAVGTPVVTPFGSTSPELTGPGLPGSTAHHLVVGQAGCAPCFRRTCPTDFLCMKSIGVASVVRAVLAAANAR